MMICHCRAVSDRVIREVVADGCDDVDEVGAICGAGTDCGGCRPTLEQLVGAIRAETRVLIGSAGQR